jgi:hypothetical protein
LDALRAVIVTEKGDPTSCEGPIPVTSKWWGRLPTAIVPPRWQVLPAIEAVASHANDPAAA